MYNRQPAPQNDVELGPKFSGVGLGSDPENPPHYTMNPEHHAKVEDVLGSPGEASRDPRLGGPHAGSPHVTVKTSLPTFSENFYFEYTDAPKSQAAQNVMHNNITTVKECPPPLATSAYGARLDPALKAINKAFGELFALFTFPFTCLILFLHHLMRLILQGVVRPLVVDSVMLVIEYIVHPITSGIVLPLWITVHTILEGISNTQMMLIRPVVAILRAIRLMDINCTRRSQVETV